MCKEGAISAYRLGLRVAALPVVVIALAACGALSTGVSVSTLVPTEIATGVPAPTAAPTLAVTAMPAATDARRATATESPSASPKSGATPKPTTTASPIPTTGVRSAVERSPTELRYALIARFGAVFYCDADMYPIARRMSGSELEQRVNQIEQNPEEYQAIVKHLGFTATAPLSADQEQQVYSEHKMLAAIGLELGGDTYRFNLRIMQSGTDGFVIAGTIDPSGAIQVASQQATVVTCPICLAGDTLIGTPQGPVAIRDLVVGTVVWTTDRAGARQPAVVVKTVKRSVPIGTPLVQLTLDDGRTLTASPLHPTTDGRVLGDLVRGDRLDGARVEKVENVPDVQGVTYDLLPPGETGAYWANGILLKSTLY